MPIVRCSSIGNRANIIVDDDGGQDYTHIQWAIDNASEGDTIYVWAGTYNESVVVNKTVTLIGNGSASTVVDRGGIGNAMYINVSWVNVSGFRFTNTGFAGIEVHWGNHTRIWNNYCDNNSRGIEFKDSDNNSISNNTCNNNGVFGIDLAYCDNNSISNNTCNNNRLVGIDLAYCDNNSISNNTCNSNGGLFLHFGIYLYESDSNSIVNNTCNNNALIGIHLLCCDSNSISNNTCNNNRLTGIFLERSDNNSISNNTCNNNPEGIFLLASSSITLMNNTMIKGGIAISLNWNTHSIDTSNTVNGKPIYYKKDATGGTVPPGVGQVILANCTGVTVENQVISNTSTGIQIGYSNANIVKNNTCNNNSDDGIVLEHSDSNSISNNTCNNNSDDGIYLNCGGSNSISNNTCNNNSDDGIYLICGGSNSISNNTYNNNSGNGILLDYDSDSNSISNNTCNDNRLGGMCIGGSEGNSITNNTCNMNSNYGIYLDDSDSSSISNNTCNCNTDNGIKLNKSDCNFLINNILQNNANHGINITDIETDNNTIHHNTFLYNNGGSIQAYDVGTDNVWDDGKEGNFWRDYTFRYPNAGHDGLVWNTPYQVDGLTESQDNYPLVGLPSLNDNSPDSGTTGDNFQFNISVSDNIGVDTVYVNWSHGELGGNLPLSLAGDYWLGNITLDHNLNDLTYIIYINDTTNLYNISDLHFTQVTDNDNPVYEHDGSPDSGTTGDLYQFNLTISDNINVDEVWVNWTHGGLSGNKSLSLSGDWWVGNITLDHNVEDLNYFIWFVDTSGNVNRTLVKVVSVIDNDPPEFLRDLTSGEPTAGKAYTFWAIFKDNTPTRGLASVWVNYSMNGMPFTMVPMSPYLLIDDVWFATVNISINATTVLYHFIAEDSGGNRINTFDPQSKPKSVKDITPPTIDTLINITVDQHEKVDFNAKACLDNIGIENYTWCFTYDGIKHTLVGAKVNFTFHDAGTYTVRLNVSDAAGNWNETIITVIVRDITPPEGITNKTLTVNQSGTVTLDASMSTDNVAIVNFTWTLGDAEKYGMIVTFTFPQPGLYNLTLRVLDAAGNIDCTSIIITVLDTEAPLLKAFIGGQEVVNEGSYKVVEGETVIFNASGSKDNYASELNYTWTIDSESWYSPIVSYSFEETGIYSIMVSVTDSAGNARNISFHVVVKRPVVPSFSLKFTDEEGNPAEGLEVIIIVDSIEHKATTDRDGKATFVNISEPRKDDDIVARKDGEVVYTGKYDPDDTTIQTKVEVPKDSYTWTIVIVVVVIVILIIVVLLLVMRSAKRKKTRDLLAEQYAKLYGGSTRRPSRKRGDRGEVAVDEPLDDSWMDEVMSSDYSPEEDLDSQEIDDAYETDDVALKDDIDDTGDIDEEEEEVEEEDEIIEDEEGEEGEEVEEESVEEEDEVIEDEEGEEVEEEVADEEDEVSEDEGGEVENEEDLDEEDEVIEDKEGEEVDDEWAEEN